MHHQQKILKAMSESQRLFKEKYNQKYYDSFGFENTYAFMVTKEVEISFRKSFRLKNIKMNYV